MAIIVVVMLVVGMAISLTFVSVQKDKSELSSLVLKNIEALALDEPVGGTSGDQVYYKFNDQHWEGDKNGSSTIGSNWFPSFELCYFMGNWGGQVVCTKGGGNCWNGTSCKT